MLPVVTPFQEKFGPWALVTGASSGIGRAIALELATRGLGVLITGRDRVKLQELRNQIPICEFVEADLATEQGLALLLERATQLNLGLVVANAGFGTSGPLLESDLGTELDMLRVNCEVPMRLAYELGPRLIARGGGGFVFLSSIVAWQGVAGQAHYSATKAYIQNLSEALAVEWRPQKVCVVSAAPGPVATEFADRSGLTLKASDDSMSVARDIVDALGRRTLVIPGRLGKTLSGMLAMAPRQLRVRIMSMIAKGLVRA